MKTIEVLIEERLEARRNRDFNRSDEIRDELKEQGILLKIQRKVLAGKEADCACIFT